MTAKPMRKKGLVRDTNPEKMPSITSGIEMTRGARPAGRPERLTSGQEVADESDVARLVMAFINNDYNIKPKV
jgi:hypothetical protein